MQSSYLKQLKRKLGQGEVAVFGDAEDNYSMITQDEIPVTQFE